MAADGGAARQDRRSGGRRRRESRKRARIRGGRSRPHRRESVRRGAASAESSRLPEGDGELQQRESEPDGQRVLGSRIDSRYAVVLRAGWARYAPTGGHPTGPHRRVRPHEHSPPQHGSSFSLIAAPRRRPIFLAVFARSPVERQRYCRSAFSRSRR